MCVKELLIVYKQTITQYTSYFNKLELKNVWQYLLSRRILRYTDQFCCLTAVACG